ncbi:MAG: hypothetical protein K9M82_04710 [Deltaproteobacteria bacterium]|nr:hypothetical protein [Deltaproteobacteria bacterium]
MDVKSAISTLSQGEKIKAGLIWASQSIELLQGLGAVERAGGIHVVKGLCAMIGHEVALVRTVTGDPAWDDVLPQLDRALVMIESGVPREATGHLSGALSRTTSILQRRMSFLTREGML